MTSGIQVARGLLVYGVCLPIAIFLGYLLADPQDLTTFAAVSVVVLLLLLPILLRWHYPLVLLMWGTSTAFYVFVGVSAWMALVMASLAIVLIQRTMSREARFVSAPSLTWPLTLLAVVVLITAEFNGGFGFRAMGSETYGGKRYLLLFTAIAGYFVLTSQRIPQRRARLYVALFAVGGIASLVGPTLYAIAPNALPLFYFFPVSVPEGISLGPEPLYARMFFLGSAGAALVTVMLARYGVGGIFSARQPWRAVLFVLFIGVSMQGGYRSLTIFLLLSFVFQFWLEGLMRSRLLPIFALTSILGVAAVVPLARHLPYTVQRAIAFLPIDVSPEVRLDVNSSSDWRLDMWKALLPKVPEHFWLGRGLGIQASEQAMSAYEVRAGYEQSYYWAILSADYHNGPLSVAIPFGIWGLAGFLWFAWAAGRLLYRNYRYGDPHVRLLNSFLLAAYAARLIVFCAVTGGFYSEFMSFTGLAGLSVALNGGMCQPAPAPSPAPARVAPLASILPRPMPGR